MTHGLTLGLALHDGEVSHALTGSWASSGKLLAVEIHEAHVLGFHESFANESRGAKNKVVSNTNGHIATITIGVIALPHAFAEITDALFEHVNLRRVKEVEDFTLGLGVIAGSPAEFIIR